MRVEIRHEPFDPWQETSAYQQGVTAGKSGAVASFVGTMRDFNEGEAVQAMTLEHYPGMTEKHIREICEQAGKRWQMLDCLVLHRVGEIQIGAAMPWTHAGLSSRISSPGRRSGRKNAWRTMIAGWSQTPQVIPSSEE